MAGKGNMSVDWDRLVLAVQRRIDPPDDMPKHLSGVFDLSPHRIVDVVLDVLTRAGGWKM